MKTLKEKIEVMQAALDGKEIQYIHDNGWEKPEGGEAVWDWFQNDYRIKPEPLECWVNIYRDLKPYAAYSLEELAYKECTLDDFCIKTIKVREVE